MFGSRKISFSAALFFVLLLSEICFCSGNSHCGLGKWYDEDSDSCTKCAVEEWCPEQENDDDVCHDGHTGHACSQCQGNHFYSILEGACQECPPKAQAVLSWLGVCSCFVFIVIVIYRRSAEAFDVGAFTIVTTHFCLVYVYFGFGVNIPGSVQKSVLPLSVLTGFVFDVLGEFAGITCLGSGDDFTFWWTMQTIAPLVLCLPFAVQSVAIQYQQQLDREADSAKPPEDRILSFDEYTIRKARSTRDRQSVQTVMFVVLTAVMFIVEASVEVWTCEKFEDGEMRLPSNPSVVCSLDDDAYTPLLAASIVIFIIYMNITAVFLAVIIESPMGRQAAADHHVTHAKLLRDATLKTQVAFSFSLLVHGPEYGRAAEHARVKSRVQTRFKIALAIKRLQAERGTRDENFDADLEVVKKKLEHFHKNRRPIPRARVEYFRSAFPVYVPLEPGSESNHIWVRGVFHDFDFEGMPLVATGRGSKLKLSPYEHARISFEPGRPVNVRDDLVSWHQQDGDPANAMAGAPLGVVGTVAAPSEPQGPGSSSSPPSAFNAAATKALSSRRPSLELDEDNDLDDAVTDIAEFVDVNLPSTAMFTFFLDLTMQMGFTFHERKGKILVASVSPGGQGGIAGMTDKCVIRRVGETTVHTQEEFEVAVIKRRIASARIRQEMLEAGEPATPLSEDDEALLGNPAVMGLIQHHEMIMLTQELSGEIERGGLDTHCTVTYKDPNFAITRRLPTDFSEFRKIAELKPFDEYWSTYGSIISAYKSSSRHFEHWANVRKVLAVVVEVSLLQHGPVVQTATMLGVCALALFLQLRLNPYDDMNSHNPNNSADAILSNNELEAILLVLQIAQLAVMLLSLFVDLSDAFLMALYLMILLLAVFVSLVALSTDAAKTAHRVLHALEPYIHAAQVWCGVSLLPTHLQEKGDDSAAAGELERRRQSLQAKRAQSSLQLLQVAREYESAKVAEEEAAVPTTGLEKASAGTAGSLHRQQALKEHLAKRQAESEEVQRAQANQVWKERRKAAQKRGSRFKTKADNVGHLGKSTLASKRSLEVLKAEQDAKKVQTKDHLLQSEKDAWEARRKKANKRMLSLKSAAGEGELGESGAPLSPTSGGGGGFSTQTSFVAHYQSPTASSLARVGSAAQAGEDHKAETKDGNEYLTVQKKLWQKRRSSLEGGHTVPQNVGHVGSRTESASFRDKARLDASKQKKAEEEKVAAEKAAWQKRQASRRSRSMSDDIGSLGRETQATALRKKAREANIARGRTRAAQDEEAQKAQAELFQRRMNIKQSKGRRTASGSSLASPSSGGEGEGGGEGGVRPRGSSLDDVTALTSPKSPSANSSRFSRETGASDSDSSPDSLNSSRSGFSRSAAAAATANKSSSSGGLAPPTTSSAGPVREGEMAIPEDAEVGTAPPPPPASSSSDQDPTRPARALRVPSRVVGEEAVSPVREAAVPTPTAASGGAAASASSSDAEASPNANATSRSGGVEGQVTSPKLGIVNPDAEMV